jgi:hypothetical protein
MLGWVHLGRPGEERRHGGSRWTPGLRASERVGGRGRTKPGGGYGEHELAASVTDAGTRQVSHVRKAPVGLLSAGLTVAVFTFSGPASASTQAPIGRPGLSAGCGRLLLPRDYRTPRSMTIVHRIPAPEQQ